MKLVNGSDNDIETCHYCGAPAVTVCAYCYKPICDTHSIDTGVHNDRDGKIYVLLVCFPDCKINWK